MEKAGSTKMNKKSNPKMINARLSQERTKALELLQAKTDNTTKMNKSSLKPVFSQDKPSVISFVNGNKNPKNKENICHENSMNCLDMNWSNFHGSKNPTTSSISPKNTDRSVSSTKMGYEDYVPFRSRKPIDVSALMRSDSISLDVSPLPFARKDTDVSFHPAEMAGRSTLHINDSKPKEQHIATKHSVEDILTSSFVEDVRKSICGLENSSCITNFSAMQKNPRPTSLFDDISLNATNINNVSELAEEAFVPAEIMQSKLLQDEISWAKEQAAVPTAVLSNEARNKLNLINERNESMSTTNSMAFNDPDFSFGRFFAKHSNDVNEIVLNSSPPKNRTAVPLISDSTIISSSEKSMYDYEFATPVIDNKRYSQVQANTTKTLATEKLNAKDGTSHDSKDSGNASSKEELLSLTAIEKILASSESGTRAAIKILSKVSNANESSKELNKMFSSIMINGESKSDSIDAVDLVKGAEQLSNLANIILENKENIQTHSKNSDSMADTLSFTESLLNTSIQNYRMSNAGHERLPLSPIPILVTEPDLENDADIDEYSNSPIAASERRKCYSKSPKKLGRAFSPADNVGRNVKEQQHEFSPNSQSPDSRSEAKSVISTTSKTPITATRNKSLSSTRLDVNRSSPIGSNRTLTPKHHGHSVLELSPLSSSQSETGIAASKKSNSLGTWQCGGAPMRTYSNNSIKSTDSTSTRSASRCSNNSEFSHRDGKIPIRATELELSWPSVKLRTDSHKSTRVKNTSNKRLAVRIETFGPGFKLINPESNNLTLLPEECRTIIVNFSPTMIGPAIGRIVFQPPRKYVTINNSNQICNATSEVTIPLYAYGGHASIIIQNLIRTPSGEPFLPMGEFCTLVRPLERSIEIYNKGPLMGFAAAFIESARLNIPEISNSIHITPECIVIEPKTSVTFRLVFQPNHSDLRNIRKFIDKVMTLAKLRIMYGDEAIRQRIRQMQLSMTAEARKTIFGRSLDKLWTRFPGERPMFSSGIYKDSTSVAQDLWTNILEQDITLTLNNNMLDETSAELSTIFTDGDSSVLFRTMRVSSPSGQLETVEE